MTAHGTVVGADEAGKGPVLGPMVAGAVRAPPAALPAVADSKRLSAGRRAELAATMAGDGRIETAVALVPVAVIDDPATDMNGLTVAAQAAAVRAVARPGESIVADAGDTDADRFARRLREAVAGPDGSSLVDRRIDTVVGVGDSGGDGLGSVAGDDEASGDGLGNVADGDGAGGDSAGDGSAGVSQPTVRAEHGADDSEAIVGAASVIAKVTRDRRMEQIGEGYDRPVGSGYPSDQTTRAFLREYVRDTGQLPDCARRSWATAQDVLEAAQQAGLDEF